MKQPSPRFFFALVGLPASGKTTIAGLLAKLLELPALDLDDTIVEEAKADIPSIFTSEGEAGFRERERRALAKMTQGNPLVLATGGGIVLNPENRRLLKEHFFTVWLQVSPATAAIRSVGGSRPLLAGVDAEARIRELESQRTPLYAECAALCVNTEGLDPRKVAEAILDKLD